MKKTYMIPTLKVVEIKPAQFIAASFQQTLGTTEVNGSAALGREARFSDWDEEEE